MSARQRPFTIGIELIDDPGWMGGTLYLRNLAICLARLPAPERPAIRLLGSVKVARDLLDAHPELAAAVEKPPGLARRLLGRVLPAAGGGLDVVYPGFGADVPGATVLKWIPDFQHRHLPGLFEPQEIAAREASIGAIAAQCGVVVVSSEVARDDFDRFYPGHAATARVWHFHSLIDTTQPSDGAVRERLGLPGKYLYLPNQFWAHKNHETVFRALARLKSEAGLEIPLVCTGAEVDRRNPGHVRDLLAYIEREGLARQVLRLGMIDRRDQVEVLRAAAAVVQPSLFEGWSTVVEDVRAVGRPLFLSDIPVHREQNPSQCTFFPPRSSEALSVAVAAQWEALAPGPDRDSEARARTVVDALILDSARSFCDIAREVRAVNCLT